MKTTTFFRILFLALLVVAGGGFTNCAHAQYQSFFGNNITEYDTAGDFVNYSTDHDPTWLGADTYRLTIRKSDTISFDGINYFVGRNDFVWPVYIREDTTLGQIFRYKGECEYLVCDMSLSVGDTFYVPFTDMCWYSDKEPLPIIADTIFYVNGLKYIQFRTIYEYFYVEMDNHGYPDTTFIPLPHLYCMEKHGIPIMFIEGIGPNFGPEGENWHTGGGGSWCDNGRLGRTDPNPFLLCVSKDGNLVFMSDERAGCEQYGPAPVKENAIASLTIYPNPAHNILNVKFKNTPVQKGTLYITDMMGRVVYSQTTDDSHLRVNIKNLDAGLYIVTWLSGEKKQSMKFIKN